MAISCCRLFSWTSCWGSVLYGDLVLPVPPHSLTPGMTWASKMLNHSLHSNATHGMSMVPICPIKRRGGGSLTAQVVALNTLLLAMMCGDLISMELIFSIEGHFTILLYYSNFNLSAASMCKALHGSGKSFPLFFLPSRILEWLIEWYGVQTKKKMAVWSPLQLI